MTLTESAIYCYSKRQKHAVAVAMIGDRYLQRRGKYKSTYEWRKEEMEADITIL